ncbi:hypothetical protein SRB17_44550 [Streptomyces sp. RB17]|uniref:hypothetical protein n=1 Tax=Streptomyces sp. RB17 TaxID=2585197 RepID=UPI001305A46A|nr:hypothetical protein [Streptomyces sp. RB17]MQY36454.1 hypothetical protein [Streptomyces sp. RB17]
MSDRAGVDGGGHAAVLDEGVGTSCGVFERVGAVADAVLYEGYLLYPYRRSSPKNRVRWQFGVLLPRDWVERDGPVTPGISGSADSWYQQTECLLRVPRADTVVRVRVRWLQMQHKQVETAGPDGRYRPVEWLRAADGATHLSFEEAVPRETELVLPLRELLLGGRTAVVGAAAGTDAEALPDGAGRTVRRRREVRAVTTVEAEPLAPELYRLRVRTENTGEVTDPRAPRTEALRQALLATHTLVGGDGLEFASLIDPPRDLAQHARGCRNAFTFPVLAGPPQQGTTGAVMLSAPIILPDWPQVAPESPGDLHDAAEIDEILTLRTMLLTDEEKAEARATDPRAAEILDRVDSMTREVFSRLHGTIRSLAPAQTRSAAERPAWWQEPGDDGPSPATDTVLVDGVPLGGGSRVLLRPRVRGADAQDMFLDGRTARVSAVLHDVDGSVHLAVTVEDDPAAELHGWYGRFHYFRPDEVQPLGDSDAPGPVTAPRPQSPRPPERPADRPEEGRFDGCP